MQLPLVSILCVTYNQEAFVAEALAGMLAQDYPNLEIVVADDGSSDGTVEILRDAESRSGGRLVVVTGKHVGITPNCNRGLRHCRGEYLAVTAGDDVLLPGKISAQVAWMEADARRVLCGHDVDAFDSATGRTTYRWSERFALPAGVGAERAVRSVPFCATAIMMRRRAMPSFGFDERLPISSDWKLWVDVLHPDGVYGWVPGVLARYRRHPGNITSTPSVEHAERMFREQLLIWELVTQDHPALAGACRDARADELLEQAKRCWGRAAHGAAVAYLLRATAERPLRMAGRVGDYVRRQMLGRGAERGTAAA